MVEIFTRENKKMVEIGEVAKEFARKKNMRYNMAFSHVFNEASCGGIMSFVEDGLDRKGQIAYRIANQSDFAMRLMEEKEK